jgi:hypothetical protein
VGRGEGLKEELKKALKEALKEVESRGEPGTACSAARRMPGPA